MKYLFSLIFISLSLVANAQNPLAIPPSLTGTTFNLNVQSGTQSFYTGTSTPTYGVNGTWMAPTIIVNKGDSITLNVTNNLPVKTTMHWHGLHVAAKNDGGPHQIINAGATWSPSFKIMNNAATFWYHPHGAGQTDPHVSKGLAGFFIVHDADELALNIPHAYGVDDIPLVIQSKAFDVLQHIAIATEMDTALFLNGTLNAYFDAPAQVIRFRLLNGSSLRSYQIGLSNNQTFYQIGTDGGLLDTSIAMTRLRLSPGERAEILINFSGMQGQNIQLKSFSSELPKGIYGADSVGMGNDTIPDYSSNFLNGADFTLIQLNIVAPTASPLNTIPHSLVTLIPLNILNATKNRTIIFDTIRLLPADIPNRAEGPFGMNNKSFDMDSINEIVYLNTTEIWKLVNKTLVAHTFHIHDVQFNVIEKNGMPPPTNERGWKDVVLVMPDDSVKFITKFEDFTDTVTPYMYHCHLLHHEDDGMMGSFLVIDSAWSVGIKEISSSDIKIYPNPSSESWQVSFNENTGITGFAFYTISGELIYSQKIQHTSSFIIPNLSIPKGQYILKLQSTNEVRNFKLLKQ